MSIKLNSNYIIYAPITCDLLIKHIILLKIIIGLTNRGFVVNDTSALYNVVTVILLVRIW